MLERSVKMYKIMSDETCETVNLLKDTITLTLLK